MVSGNDGEYQNSIAITTYLLCNPNTVDGEVFIYKFSCLIFITEDTEEN